MKKNYLRLFVSYCKKHSIWFAVCADGTLDYVTFFGYSDQDYYPLDDIRFGTKKAYEWLLCKHKRYLFAFENCKGEYEI